MIRTVWLRVGRASLRQKAMNEGMSMAGDIVLLERGVPTSYEYRKLEAHGNNSYKNNDNQVMSKLAVAYELFCHQSWS